MICQFFSQNVAALHQAAITLPTVDLLDATRSLVDSVRTQDLNQVIADSCKAAAVAFMDQKKPQLAEIFLLKASPFFHHLPNDQGHFSLLFAQCLRAQEKFSESRSIAEKALDSASDFLRLNLINVIGLANIDLLV
jgi:hypothetical protein